MVRLTNRSPARNGWAGAAEVVSWLVCGLSPPALVVADPLEPAGFDAQPATVISATAPARTSLRNGLRLFRHDALAMIRATVR